MNFTKRVLDTIKHNGWSGWSFEQLMVGFEVVDSTAKKALKKAIGELVDSGELIVCGKYKYKLAEEMELLKGKLQGNRKGFAFLVGESKEQKDIFIAARNMNGALHGDTVLVQILKKPDEESDEGQVVSILERGCSSIVGTYEAQGQYGFVVPDDDRFCRDVFIRGKNSLKVKSGDKVVVKITSYPKSEKNPEGEIMERLGEKSRDTDILSIIRSFKLYEEFKPETSKYAKKFKDTLLDKDKLNREDLTGECIITIDGEDAKDLDDAISLREVDGMYELGVHIADVSNYVKDGSPIDKEALLRGTSVYFPDRVYPMLPRELSNGICSLNGGVERLTLSCFMTIDHSGDVVTSRLSESFIKSTARMTYTSVNLILDGDETELKKYSELRPMFERMQVLSEILTAKRTRRGMVDLDIPEFRVIMDDNNEIEDIVPEPRGKANRLIEEFMIVANETVAQTLYERELPAIYRIHEKPLPEKVDDFRQFVSRLGYKLNGDADHMRPCFYSQLLEDLEGTPVRSLVNTVMLRTMMKARYSEENTGHFGLSSECYCHFTSPIRRYPDLFVHRMVKHMLHNNLDEGRIADLEKSASRVAIQSTEREKIADDAERAVDDYFKAEYMKKHLGECFDGIISGVKDFGVFVALPNTIEGLLRIDSLPADQYDYFEKDFTLRGKQHVYKLGDTIRIRVAGVDTMAGKTEFTMGE